MRLVYFNMSEPSAAPPHSDRSTHPPSCVDDAQPRDVQESPSPLTASATPRSADRQGATSIIRLMVLDTVPITSTPHMLRELLSHTGPLVSISGRMQLDSLMMAITQVGSTTVPVPHPQVEILLLLLGWITTANLESLVDGKTTDKLLLMTRCGTVMDVIQPTTAAADWDAVVLQGPHTGSGDIEVLHHQDTLVYPSV